MGLSPLAEDVNAVRQRPSLGRATHAVIDLAALRHNLQRARTAAPNSRIMAAVKANAYGHGLERVGRALAKADALGVAGLNEAVRLRDSGVSVPIVLLEGFFDAEELDPIARMGLEVVVHHVRQVDILERAQVPAPIAVWLKVDTGMHRLGLPPEAVRSAWERLRRTQAVAGPLGFMTHLANADDPNDRETTPRQLRTFEEATAGLPGERAIANSAGLLGWPQSHAQWVRPGIMLYGVSPFLAGRAQSAGLRPVMTLRSELIAVNRAPKGARVGYGGTWVCPEEMPIGVAAVGYGDGYPRHARCGTPVLVNGRRVPLIGRVSMDMITVDLRGQPDAQPGDPVVLWGEGLPVEEVAEWADTIAYELLCSVTPRVEVLEVDGREPSG